MDEHNSDFDAVKTDLNNLYEHVGALLDQKTQEVQAQWEETRTTLEMKKEDIEMRAADLAQAGSAASGDMKAGFSAALSELRKAFAEAKGKFDHA